MAKILLVEDDSVTIAILMSRLKARNHQVIVAATGEEGIELAAEQLPDLILMDMILPGMHGLEATIRLKDDPRTKDIPIFAVTAVKSSEFEQACYQDGICVFIRKPYDFKELFAYIEKYTSQQKKAEKMVLIINEDPALVTLMAAYLKDYGYRIISNPPRMFNLDQVREIKPLVILLDIAMIEDWGGVIFDILKKSTATHSIPVILMASELSPEEIKKTADRLGAEEYIPRLFEFDEIDRKIKKVSQD
jgi:CheY-like chemotaxis protein